MLICEPCSGQISTHRIIQAVTVTWFSFQGQMPDTQIGRVFVQDADDWDVPDKIFYWDSSEQMRFRLDEDTGMVTVRQGTPDGRYTLRFKVYDRKHTRTEVNMF